VDAQGRLLSGGGVLATMGGLFEEKASGQALVGGEASLAQAVWKAEAGTTWVQRGRRSEKGFLGGGWNLRILS